MKDINYFLDVAQNSRQGEFELDFADIIEVYDTSETTITTECGRTLVISWNVAGFFKSYEVIFETPIMEDVLKFNEVKEVIAKLQAIDVDGEAMQYILKRVGMEDQMLKQLIGEADDYRINWYTNLRNIAKNNQPKCR
jgi:hypothetical protein